jgi:5-exo-hydroxycamphor dehydrogenase
MPVNRRMVFTAAGRPLEMWEVDVDEPRHDELLLRTSIAGVCGTDAHRLRGDLADPARPIAFGHEGIGVVTALGSGVRTDHSGVPLAEGDLVYWSPSGDRPGAPPAIGWPPPAEIGGPAAFQDYVTLPRSNVYSRIPDGVAPEHVIAFGCAMPTALGGIARLGGIAPGSTVVVQGCGPVGLASTLLAAASSARQIIVIGAPADRLRAATRLGATTTIPLDGTTVASRRDVVLDLTNGRGAEIVIEAAGHLAAFDEGMAMLGHEGRYLVLGLYSGRGTVAFDPVPLNNRSLAIIGSMGPAAMRDYQTTVDLAARLGAEREFDRLITHRFGLSQLEAAISAAGSGDAIKAIVVPGLDHPDQPA